MHVGTFIVNGSLGALKRALLIHGFFATSQNLIKAHHDVPLFAACVLDVHSITATYVQNVPRNDSQLQSVARNDSIPFTERGKVNNTSTGSTLWPRALGKGHTRIKVPVMIQLPSDYAVASQQRF